MSGIRQAIMRIAGNDPAVAQAVQQIKAQLANTPVSVEELENMIQVLEFLLEHPEKYQQVVQLLSAKGIIDQTMVPPQFDQRFIISVLIALYGLQDDMRGGPSGMGGMSRTQVVPGMAKGGLAAAAEKIQAAGRGGDTVLAHINPREAEMLQRMGGAGTINPVTGLREYKGGFFKSVIKVVASVAVNILLPGVGTVISGAIGGALGSAIVGDNVLQGAALGAITGGVGKAVGEAVGLEGAAANIVGSGLTGAGYSAATGKDPLSGALSGVAGGAIGSLAETAISPTSALKTGLQEAGKTAGNLITAGATPAEAVTGGAFSGLVSGLTYKPTPTRGTGTSADVDTTGTPESSTGLGIDPNTGSTQLALDPKTGMPLNYSPLEMRGGELMPVAGTPGVNAAGDSFTWGGEGTPYGSQFATPTGGVAVNSLNTQTGGTVQQNIGSFDVDSLGNRTWVAPTENLSTLEKIGSTFGVYDKAPVDYSTYTPGTANAASSAAKSKGILGTGVSTGDLLTAGGVAALGSALLSPSIPEDVQTEINQLSEEQQAYFEQPNVTTTDPETGVTTPSVSAWDWDTMRNDAAAANQTLSAYMANNWDKVTGGYYTYYVTGEDPTPTQMAQGGALTRYARGTGSGRADTINARLSDGEYVIDAETVALLGDGSGEEGARRLNQMRQQIRKQKGKALAKGEFSPNAKSPLSYIKEEIA